MSLLGGVGLIGSHLHGIGEAWWYDPSEGFDTVASTIALVVLLVTCIGLVMYIYALYAWPVKMFNEEIDQALALRSKQKHHFELVQPTG